jgi:hypothetical protein
MTTQLAVVTEAEPTLEQRLLEAFEAFCREQMASLDAEAQAIADRRAGKVPEYDGYRFVKYEPKRS